MSIMICIHYIGWRIVLASEGIRNRPTGWQSIQESIMSAVQKTVLVLGATGRQGGATARHLLTKGWRVRAFARHPEKPAAQALHQAGAEVIQGDFDDQASLEAA